MAAARLMTDVLSESVHAAVLQQSGRDLFGHAHYRMTAIVLIYLRIITRFTLVCLLTAKYVKLTMSYLESEL